MEVVFNPPRDKQQSGTVSFASWQNRDLQAAMLRAFAIRGHEELKRLEVTPDGIRAIIETKVTNA